MTMQSAFHKFNNLFIPVYLIFLGIEVVGVIVLNHSYLLKSFWSVSCNFLCTTSFSLPGPLGVLFAAGVYFWLKRQMGWVWGTSVIPFILFSYLYLQPTAF